MRLALPIAALLAGTVLVSGAGARNSVFSEFKTPSGNIGCVYTSAPAELRCDIGSGLNPRPAQPASCDLDFGDSLVMPKFGRVGIGCHGDTARDPRAPILAYGRTWVRGGFSCTSRTTGLTCRNPGNHGFFLSRESWRRF